MADETWQDDLLSKRHMHNRGPRALRGRGKNNKSVAVDGADGGEGTGFDVRRMFATYSLKCPKATTEEAPHAGNVVLGARRGRRGANGAAQDEGFLEIYRMTPDGNGLVGSFLMPVNVAPNGSLSQVADKKKAKQDRKQADVEFLEATVVLAGSRKTMKKIVSELEETQAEQEFEIDGHDKDDSKSSVDDDRSDHESDSGSVDENDDEVSGSKSSPGEEGEEDDDDDDDEENATEDRYQRPFEKNSFRSPKFWVEWRSSSQDEPSIDGERTAPSSKAEEVGSSNITGDNSGASKPVEPDTARILSGTGYLVFQGNDCRKFSGTISCLALGWDNLPVKGHRLAGAGSRDVLAPWPVAS